MLVTARGHAEAPVAAAGDAVEPAATPAASTAMRARSLGVAVTEPRIQAGSRDMRPRRRQTGTRARSNSSSPGRMGRLTFTYVSTPCLHSPCGSSRERTAKMPRRTSVELPRLGVCGTYLGTDPRGGLWLSPLGGPAGDRAWIRPCGSRRCRRRSPGWCSPSGPSAGSSPGRTPRPVHVRRGAR
jgi:hypothetical protein